MKVMARYIIYITFMVMAVIVMLTPISVWLDTGYLDVKDMVIHAAIGFTLVFAGTEASEGLKKRWD